MLADSRVCVLATPESVQAKPDNTDSGGDHRDINAGKGSHSRSASWPARSDMTSIRSSEDCRYSKNRQ
jgi:hypothetical protein